MWEAKTKSLIVGESFNNGMDVQASLQRAGFRQNEVKAYLTLLKLGKATSYTIVKEAGVSSGKIYETMDRLIERGLVSYVIINGKKYFEAANPDRLLDYMHKREEEMHEETESIQKILPQLKDDSKQKITHTKAEVYEGIAGIKSAYELMLSETGTNKEILILGAPKEAGDKLNAYFDDFNNRRIKKNISLRIILNRGHPRESKLKSLNKTKVKVFPKEIITPAWINVFGDYVATFNLAEEPIVFLIKNKRIADSYRQYFDLMWKMAK